MASVLAAGVVATGIFAGKVWQDFRGEQAQGAQLRERISALEAAQLAAAAAPPSAPATLPADAALQPMSTVAPTPGPSSQPAASSTAKAPANAATMAQAMLSDPQTMEMTRSMMRMLLPQQYPDIAKDMSMSAAEVEKLFDTLARQQMDLGIGSTELFAGGQMDPAAMEQIERKVQQQQKAHDAELATLLGSKYPQWQDYQGTAAARQLVEQLQAALDADNKLGESARKSLIAALAIEQGRITREERDDPTPSGSNMQEMLANQLKRSTELNQRRIQVASPHLTVAQRDTYKRLLEQQDSMTSMMMRSLLAPAGAKP